MSARNVIKQRKGKGMKKKKQFRRITPKSLKTIPVGTSQDVADTGSLKVSYRQLVQCLQCGVKFWRKPSFTEPVLTQCPKCKSESVAMGKPEKINEFLKKARKRIKVKRNELSEAIASYLPPKDERPKPSTSPHHKIVHRMAAREKEFEDDLMKKLGYGPEWRNDAKLRKRFRAAKGFMNELRKIKWKATASGLRAEYITPTVASEPPTPSISMSKRSPSTSSLLKRIFNLLFRWAS